MGYDAESVAFIFSLGIVAVIVISSMSIVIDYVQNDAECQKSPGYEYKPRILFI